MVARAKGFGTCLPMRRVRYRKRWQDVHRAVHLFPVLSGYLFIGMSPDTPGWPELMAPSSMLAVVGINDCPYVLDKCVIDQFLQRYESDFYKRSEQAKRPDPPDYKVGDHVKVLAGPFETHNFPVKKMNQKQALIATTVLGKEFEFWISVDDLRKSA